MQIEGEEGGTDAPLSEQVAEEAAVSEEVVTDAGDAGGGESTAEADAREMGWVPESEWKGDKKPAKFFSAEEFIERGQTILPIVQKRAKDAEARLEALKKEHEDRFAKIERMNQIALAKQRTKLEADFEARMERAVELGDTEDYKAAKKEKAAALKELDETAKEPEEKTQAGALTPTEVAAFSEWRADNKWFQSDRKLTALMDAEFAEVSDEMPAASFAQKLEEAKSRVASVFPEKFGEKPSAKRAGAVESGSRIPGGGQKGRLADKLPAEAKQAAQTLIRDGIYANTEEYAKDYFDSEEV
jgi:hypothetical protein